MLPSMDPLHATIEEFAADGYTHIEGHRPRCRMTRLRPISWLLRISMVSVLALLSFCPVTWTAEAQETDDAARLALPGAQLTFRTLDDNTQQVNADEIWRIRGTATGDEPPGSIVIDYAFERLYVKTASLMSSRRSAARACSRNSPCRAGRRSISSPAR